MPERRNALLAAAKLIEAVASPVSDRNEAAPPTAPFLPAT